MDLFRRLRLWLLILTIYSSKNKNYIIDILLTYLFKVSSAFRLVQFSIISLSRLNFLIVGSNVLIQLHDCKNNVLLPVFFKFRITFKPKLKSFFIYAV